MKVIAWELTRRCKLKCQHCRASAVDTHYENEFTTEEAKRVIESLSKNLPVLLIITGGDPLLRTDIFEITSYASSKGLRVVMAVCGSSVDDNLTKDMLQSGVSGISLSLDGYDSKTHDEFRGVDGSFNSTISAAKLAQNNGMPFQINTTLTIKNCDDLEKINDLVLSLGARVHDIFVLVPTGRGSELKGLINDKEKYEAVLYRIAQLNLVSKLKIKVTCAPQYSRIWNETKNTLKKNEEQLLRERPNGCMAGDGFVFISHLGELQPCGFFDVPCGNLRENKYDFWSLYQNSTVFANIKNKELYIGKCGACNYWAVCKGCRARSLSINKDYLSDEVLCSYRTIEIKK